MFHPPPDLTFLPPVIAHRGARADAPENTMAAFQSAHEQGAVWVETDVKITQDGMPILMHDDTLDRTTNGTGSVADTAWEEIKHLDSGRKFATRFAGEPVLRMTSLLRFVLNHHMRVNLEIKPCAGRTQATAMVTLIEASKIWPADAPPPLISSFDIEALMIASRLHPDWPRGLLLDEGCADWMDLVRMTGASTLNLNEELLDDTRLAMFRQAGIPLLAYTVNDPARARHLLSHGVSAVFTDSPAALLHAL